MDTIVRAATLHLFQNQSKQKLGIKTNVGFWLEQQLSTERAAGNLSVKVFVRKTK